MNTLDQYFDQFLRERTYLNNVTPKTREWPGNAARSILLCSSGSRTTRSSQVTPSQLSNVSLVRFVFSLHSPHDTRCAISALGSGGLHCRAIASAFRTISVWPWRFRARR